MSNLIHHAGFFGILFYALDCADLLSQPISIRGVLSILLVYSVYKYVVDHFGKRDEKKSFNSELHKISKQCQLELQMTIESHTQDILKVISICKELSSQVEQSLKHTETILRCIDSQLNCIHLNTDRIVALESTVVSLEAKDVDQEALLNEISVDILKLKERARSKRAEGSNKQATDKNSLVSKPSKMNNSWNDIWRDMHPKGNLFFG